MTRAFLADPVPSALLDGVLDAARRAPSAGFTQGIDLVVLEGPTQTERFWDVSLPAGERRDGFYHPGLLQAPVLVIPVCDPDAYVRRYAEPDKAVTGLGKGRDRWPVPYWTVDASFAAMALQYAAVAAGLGVLFFGTPEGLGGALEGLGVPAGHEAVGAVAIGWADPEAQVRGSAATRTRRPLAEVVHRGGWQGLDSA